MKRQVWKDYAKYDRKHRVWIITLDDLAGYLAEMSRRDKMALLPRGSTP